MSEKEAMTWFNIRYYPGIFARTEENMNPVVWPVFKPERPKN